MLDKAYDVDTGKLASTDNKPTVILSKLWAESFLTLLSFSTIHLS